MRSAILISLITILAPVMFSQTDAERERLRQMRELVMRPVVYKVAGMENVKVVRDIDYAKSGDPYRKMDVYLPPALRKADRKPAVLFIHGGTSEQYTPKDWGIFTSWGRLVAASGLVGVTFTHRLGFPKTALEDGAADVQSAIDYVRQNASSLNIDKDRICLVAFSAGGPMLHLTIIPQDGAPVTRWDDLQRIKNEVIGPECEAVQLFPAEGRLQDTVNAYHLFALADRGRRFPFGWQHRDVRAS